LLARLRLAQGDVPGAVAVLDETEAFVRRYNFVFRMPDVAAAQVLTLLRQGRLVAAAQLAQTYELPISQARVYLAQGDASTALAVLEPLRQKMEAKGWQDEQLKVIVLQAVAYHAHGEKDKAVQLLGDALTLAEPGGFIRIFVDEGPPMKLLIAECRLQIARRAHGESNRHTGTLLASIDRLLGAFPGSGARAGNERATNDQSEIYNLQSALVEPLSIRERDVLRLLGTELNGPEIARSLMISLNTLRTHTKNIFTKLGVNNRRAAVRRAEELDLL
jgi:LuxR family maltose regulon positive regulatory protein